MKVLVTGATGDVGRHVVSGLHQEGIEVRAFVRDADKARRLLGDVELAIGDLSDSGSVRSAINGADRVFLACGNVRGQLDYETSVVRAAQDAGVERLVKLSAEGAEIGSPLEFWDWHGRIEKAVAETQIPAVILRPTSYMTKILGSPDVIKQTGKLFLPAGDAKVAVVDPVDVGAVGARVLLDDGYEGQTYTLSGPESITFAGAAERLSDATGKQIEYVPIPDEGARQGMLDAGMPEWLVNNLITLFGQIRQGVLSGVTDAVSAITGREPSSFADFARQNAALF